MPVVLQCFTTEVVLGGDSPKELGMKYETLSKFLV